MSLALLGTRRTYTRTQSCTGTTAAAGALPHIGAAAPLFEGKPALGKWVHPNPMAELAMPSSISRRRLCRRNRLNGGEPPANRRQTRR